MLRLKPFIFLVVIFSLFSPSLAHASSHETLSPRIVNGVPASISDMPYQVQLAPNYSVDGEFLCGGSLIALDWVLTAAHCVEPRSGQDLSVTVYAGSSTLYDGVPRFVTNVYIHPNYANGFQFLNDIALLKLDSPYITMPGAIETVALPDDNVVDLSVFPEVSSQGIISGWGSTSFGGSVSFSLNKASVTVLADLSSRCGSYTSFQFYPQVMICAQGGSSPNFTDACQGDSGGPLAIEESGVTFLAGVTSFGVQCALQNYPGVYTRVSSFLPWIAPESPSNFTGVYDSDSISLSAEFPNSPASPVTHVELYRSVDDSDFSLLESFAFVSDFSYTDFDVESDSSYRYRLQYVNSVSESNPGLQKYSVSPVISTSTPTPAPSPPPVAPPSVPSSPPASIPSAPSPPSVSPGGGGSLHGLTELRPSSGSVSGGYLVSLIGFGFSTVRDVKFGGVSVPFTLRSDAHIEVDLPPFTSPGPVDVQVILAPDVGSALAPGGFLFLPDVPSSAPPGSSPSLPPGISDPPPPVAGTVSLKNPKKTRVLSSGLRIISDANVKKTYSRSIPFLAPTINSSRSISIPPSRNTRLSFAAPTPNGSVYVKSGSKFVKIGSFTNASRVSLPVIRLPQGVSTLVKVSSDEGSFFVRIVSKQK